MKKVFRNDPFQSFPPSPEKEEVIETEKSDKKEGACKEGKEPSVELPRNPINHPVGIINDHEVEQPQKGNHKASGDIFFAQQHLFSIYLNNCPRINPGITQKKLRLYYWAPFLIRNQKSKLTLI